MNHAHALDSAALIANDVEVNGCGINGPGQTDGREAMQRLEDGIVLMFATLLAELRAEGVLSAEAQSRMFARVDSLMGARIAADPDDGRTSALLYRIRRALPDSAETR